MRRAHSVFLLLSCETLMPVCVTKALRISTPVMTPTPPFPFLGLKWFLIRGEITPAREVSVLMKAEVVGRSVKEPALELESLATAKLFRDIPRWC